MKAVGLVGLAGLALLLNGCRGEQPYDDIEIQAEAREGCRAPLESGCATCCRDGYVMGSDCVSDPGHVLWCSDTTIPWYNVGTSTTCEDEGDPPACASCTERDERDLRALTRPPGCDCSTADTTMDPCMLGGCDCYCALLEELLAACPPAQ